MPFQTQVFSQMGIGVQGEVYAEYPTKAESFQLISALASYNVIGATAYTVTSQGIAAAGNVGGARVFAGILVAPKTYALRGDGSDPLNPSLTLPNYTQGELLTVGVIVARLSNTSGAINAGDLVIYDNTTGLLETISPATALPVGKSPAFASVDYFSTTGAAGGVLAVIYVNCTPKVPTP